MRSISTMPGAGKSLSLRGHTDTVHSAVWSPDGKFLASGSWDQTVRIWDARNGTPIHTLRGGPLRRLLDGGLSPDGRQLAAGAFDMTAKVWDAGSGRLIHSLRGHSGGVLSVSWSPDGKRVASASFDCTIKVWDVASGSETVTLRGHTLAVQSVTLEPGRKTPGLGWL